MPLMISGTGQVIIQNNQEVLFSLNYQGQASFSGELTASKIITDELSVNKLSFSSIENLKPEIIQIINNYQQKTASLSATFVNGAVSLTKVLTSDLITGFLKAREISGNIVILSGENAKLISPLVQTDKLVTDLISPLVDNNLTIDLSDSEGEGSLDIIGNASISGTLTVEEISSPSLDQYNDAVESLSDKYATASAIIASIQEKYSSFDQLLSSQASSSASLDPLDTTNLSTDNATISASLALSSSSLESLTTNSLFTTDLQVNNTLLANSLNSNNQEDTLYLQPLANAPLNLMAGLLTLTPNGQVIVNGDVYITGSLIAQNIKSLNGIFHQLDTDSATISGTLNIKSYSESGFGTLIASVENGDLDIKLATSSAFLNISLQDSSQPVASISATGEATFAKINLSDSSSGQAVIPTGERVITLDHYDLTPQSQIIITFTSDYSPATKYWVDLDIPKKQFIIYIDYPVNQDTTINYIVVN